MQNKKRFLKFEEKKEKKKDSLLRWFKSAPSVERVEEREPETPTSQPCSNIMTPTQPRFKINDLLNIAPDTGKKKFRSQTTVRWGNVIEDPVWGDGKWMYTIRLKSESRGRDDKFEEDILSFKVKEQDPAYMVASFYTHALPIIYY